LRFGRCTIKSNMDLSARKAALLSSISREFGPSQEVLSALSAVKREEFVPEGLRHSAYEDVALSLGWGSTISQPSMVAIVLQEARIAKGMRVLEAGCGCGYLLALLEEMGAVASGIELVSHLADQAASTLKQLGYAARVAKGDARQLPTGPFDRIVFSAAVAREPDWALHSLSPEGFVLAPVGYAGMQELMRIGKGWTEGTGRLCRFVRFVE